MSIIIILTDRCLLSSVGCHDFSRGTELVSGSFKARAQILGEMLPYKWIMCPDYPQTCSGDREMQPFLSGGSLYQVLAMHRFAWQVSEGDRITYSIIP